MLLDYIAPEQIFIICPNQDVVYGMGFMSLDEQLVIVQVPDIGERFWVYTMYHARNDQIGHLEKPYGSKPGFYLLAGPNWQGEIPDGIIEVLRSPTALANVIPDCLWTILMKTAPISSPLSIRWSSIRLVNLTVS